MHLFFSGNIRIKITSFSCLKMLFVLWPSYITLSGSFVLHNVSYRRKEKNHNICHFCITHTYCGSIYTKNKIEVLGIFKHNLSNRRCISISDNFSPKTYSVPQKLQNTTINVKTKKIKQNTPNSICIYIYTISVTFFFLRLKIFAFVFVIVIVDLTSVYVCGPLRSLCCILMCLYCITIVPATKAVLELIMFVANSYLILFHISLNFSFNDLSVVYNRFFISVSFIVFKTTVVNSAN